MRNADLALYRAKHDGRNRAAFYDPAMRAKAAIEAIIGRSV